MREAVSVALKQAMKARDAARTSSLRLIGAAFKERDIEARGRGRDGASDEELVATLAKMIRQRKESARTYEEGGRPELAEKERSEIAVIRGFMPAQMDDTEVRDAIGRAIRDAGAATVRDMGRVMALLKERHAGQMDFGRAGALVKSTLGQAEAGQ